MKVDDLYHRLQSHFTDGLVTIIGSGLSVAEGIPGMGGLASHLLKDMTARIPDPLADEWGRIAALLGAGTDLESALIQNAPSPALEECIVASTADLVGEAEKTIINDVVSGRRTLRLSRLLPHMLKPNTGMPIVTTNYDRLIELAAEMAGLGVDSMFVGHHYGTLNPKESQLSFCRRLEQRRRQVTMGFADRVVLAKPHGSLDWFLSNDEPIRCPVPLSLPRLIITPGFNKYAAGYERPFDTHRERANEAIDKAARFLIVGYGFNDNHLETHLSAQLRRGKPALVLTRTCSDRARALMRECSGMWVVSKPHTEEHSGISIMTQDEEHFVKGPDLWDIGVLVDEVLEP